MYWDTSYDSSAGYWDYEKNNSTDDKDCDDTFGDNGLDDMLFLDDYP